MTRSPSPAGLGRSKDAAAPAPVGQPAPGAFLKAVVEALGLAPAVLVSPSLSGMYSLPFLFQHGHLLKAYVPVAPICTEKFEAERYGRVEVSGVWAGAPSLPGPRLSSGRRAAPAGAAALRWARRMASVAAACVPPRRHPP